MRKPFRVHGVFPIMLSHLRTDRLSWGLAAAYVHCGLLLFLLARKLALVLSALQPPLLLPTRLFLWVGPSGWLAIFLALSALLLARHIAFRQHWLNHGVTVALWAALSAAVVGVICLTVVVLLQPACVLRSTIAGQ